MKQCPLSKGTENGQMFGLNSEIVSIEQIQQRNAPALKSRKAGLEIGLQFEVGGKRGITYQREEGQNCGSSLELANIKNLFVQCRTSKDTGRTEELHTPVTYHNS